MMHNNVLFFLLTFCLFLAAIVADAVRATQEQPNTIFTDSLLEQFEAFIIRHGKTYSSAKEHTLRFDIFKRNLKVIERLNAEATGDLRFGVTPFSDLTDDEFEDMYFSPWDFAQEDLLTRRYPNPSPPSSPRPVVQPSPRPPSPRPVVQSSPRPPSPRPVQSTPGAASSSNPKKRAGSPTPTYPTRFDWRDNNKAYPHTEHTRGCSACYAFCTAGALEIVLSKHAGKVIRFSKQQIVDCSTNDKCAGGRIDEAFDYMQKVGLFFESDYPYLARNSTCEDQKPKPKQKIIEHIITSGAENIIKGLPICPVAVPLYAMVEEMKNYKGGILSPKNCPSDVFNHGVVIIGYGTVPAQGNEPIKRYWICRNTLWPTWGEQGHFRIEMGLCGIGKWVHLFKVGLPRPPSPDLYDLPDTLGS